MASDTWRRFYLTQHADSDLPGGLDFAGTYVVFSGDVCLYVGQSQNVGKRLRSHIKMGRYTNWWITRWGQYPYLSIAVKKESYRYERMATEARLINRLKPVCNILGGGQQRR